MDQVAPEVLRAFKEVFSHLDFTMTEDAWGRKCFYHSHVQALWAGWKARALYEK